MTIQYRTESNQPPRRRSKDQSSHLGIIAGVVIFVFAAVAFGMWFLFSRSLPETKTTNAPAVQQVPVLDRIPYAPRDGVVQCNSKTPIVASEEQKTKRTLCYYAVMVIFDTNDICSGSVMDAEARPLCINAQVLYEQHAAELKDKSGATAKTPAVSQTSDAVVVAVPVQSQSSGTTGTGGGNQGQTGGTSNGNTTNGSVNGNTNANQNTNTNASTNGNSNGGGTNQSSNGSGTGNANSSGNTNTNQDQDGVLCTNEQGQIILLQHTNSCQ